MDYVGRFGVSIDKDILKQFDQKIKKIGYPTRSKAIEDLIIDFLTQEKWEEGKEGFGIIGIVYDHHKRGVVNKIIDVQHEYPKIIISTLHVHLDHANCLEIIVTSGKINPILELKNKLKTTKGVKYCSLNIVYSKKG